MDYKATLNLPRTSFPMKAELPKREPEFLAHWAETDLYGQIRKARAGGTPFILHDGPPYANGDIHIGHALNKVLKDLIVRYKTMRSFEAPYVPGWDCHGMPIEHQLFKELKLTKQQITQTDFREKARSYAQRYVEVQREQFKRLGVLGDWPHPYLTMDQDYVLAILRVFRELVAAGYIYRGKKPVYWCASCETALAEAEVEYEDRQDISIYVKFPLLDESVRALPAFSKLGRRISFIAWTTTPWTLPANVAVALHPYHPYRVMRGGNDEAWIVADAIADSFLDNVIKQRGDTFFSMRGAEIVGSSNVQYRRPFSSLPGKAVTDENVSIKEGTGVVHIAPGHGQEDYVIGQRYHLDVLSPVDHQGKFTSEIPEFAGQSVFDANARIIKRLDANDRLIHQEPLTHSYPYCWRCKQPVIFRATPQWFLSVEHQGLRRRLLEAVKRVEWIPPAGLNRIAGMLASRPDWCLSRQRYWGTPIPVLHCERCQRPLDDPKIIQQIEEALRSRGIDAWFSVPVRELLPDVTCPECRGSALRPDTDILDVWFDSGVSHEGVLKTRQGLRWPAHLYLEGSDQHRGWFQVSLIPAVALHNQPPYEQVLTHGFVVDGEGRKMSKSLGNVIAPQDIMERYGADILRLWVASCDYREDVRISTEILTHVAESYRKVRNTFRYLLANLYDFNPQRSRVPEREYPELDRWVLDRTRALLKTVTSGYEAYQFHEVTRAVYQFCVQDLSSFYLDVLKDRLYTEAAASAKRRCAQTVLYDILNALVKILAPILVVTTEEVWQVMRGARWVDEPSVHLATWPKAPESHFDGAGRQRWETFLLMRDAVMKALEEQRSRGVIGSPLEARVTLLVNDRVLQQLCEAHRDTLAEAFVVSGVEVQADGMQPTSGHSAVPGLVEVKVERAPGGKCQRCWKYLTSVGFQAAHPHLCERCARVVTMSG